MNNQQARFQQESMRFTASVMGNPKYLEQIKNDATNGMKIAKDCRRDGLEKVNAYHKNQFDKRFAKEKALDRKRKDETPKDQGVHADNPGA